MLEGTGSRPSFLGGWSSSVTSQTCFKDVLKFKEVAVLKSGWPSLWICDVQTAAQDRSFMCLTSQPLLQVYALLDVFKWRWVKAKGVFVGGGALEYLIYLSIFPLLLLPIMGRICQSFTTTRPLLSTHLKWCWMQGGLGWTVPLFLQ